VHELTLQKGHSFLPLSVHFLHLIASWDFGQLRRGILSPCVRHQAIILYSWWVLVWTAHSCRACPSAVNIATMLSAHIQKPTTWKAQRQHCLMCMYVWWNMPINRVVLACAFLILGARYPSGTRSKRKTAWHAHVWKLIMERQTEEIWQPRIASSSRALMVRLYRSPCANVPKAVVSLSTRPYNAIIPGRQLSPGY